jgi:hypothetical protein
MGLAVRDATRQQPWLAACQVAPASCEPVLPRLATLLVPFVATCCRQARNPPAQTSLGGWLSAVERNKVAASASRFGPDRLPRPRFMGWAPGEDGPWRPERPRHVAAHWGHAAGVLVFAPAGVPTSGTASVGVARQWCGRLGQVDPCPGAISWGSVAGAGHPLVDLRLDGPHAWTTAQARRDTAGGPNAHRG